MPPWAATVCDLVGKSFVMHLHVLILYDVAVAYHKTKTQTTAQGVDVALRRKQYHVKATVWDEALICSSMILLQDVTNTRIQCVEVCAKTVPLDMH